MQEPRQQIDLRGWITPAVGRLELLITAVPETFLESRREAQTRAQDDAYTARRAKRVDLYMAVSILVEAAIYGFIWGVAPTAPVLAWIVAFPVFWKLMEIPSVVMRITLFNRLDAAPGVPPVVPS